MLGSYQFSSFCDASRSPGNLGKIFPMFDVEHLNAPRWCKDLDFRLF